LLKLIGLYLVILVGKIGMQSNNPQQGEDHNAIKPAISVKHIPKIQPLILIFSPIYKNLHFLIFRLTHEIRMISSFDKNLK